MKKLIISAVALGLLAVSAAGVQADSIHIGVGIGGHPHHRHQVCGWQYHHHHRVRVCSWR